MKKKIAAAIAALAVAAGFLAGGTAAAQPDQSVDISDPFAVVQEADIPKEPALSGSAAQGIVKKKFKKRGAFLALPASILGGALRWLLSLLWKGVLSPIGSTLLGWALTALVVLAAAAVGLKAAFPNTPLKEILTKKNVKRILVLAFFACGFFSLLKLGWPELERFENAAQALIGVALSCYAVYRICRKHARKAERI